MSEINIQFTNQQSQHAIDPRPLVAATRAILIDAGIERAMLSLVVLDDDAIHEVNRKHLAHDYATDVLSFLLDDGPLSFHGEVIVSAETAARDCGDFGNDMARELLLYAIHGTLHLVGYNDKSDHERVAMRAAETRYLNQFSAPLVPTPSLGEPAT